MTFFPQAIPADLSGTLDGRLLGGRGAVAWSEEGIELRLPRIGVGTDAPSRDPEPAHLDWRDIDGVIAGEHRLEIAVGARGHVIAEGDDRVGLTAREVEARLFRIPELTRALRALGSQRGSHADRAAHATYFAPLLAARREAAMRMDVGDTDGALHPLGADALRTALRRGRAALAESSPDGAPRRAMLARLGEACEPLEASLEALAVAEGELRRAGALVRATAWRRWSGALARVFEMADRCWPAVDATLGERLDAHRPARSAWWRRGPGRGAGEGERG
ncbi:MAG: hypothetical protein ACYC3Q_06850 [Gemmatimonadaceae bacterium]